MSDNTVQTAFQKRLKEAMRRAGITQVELAERAGISQPGISAYINGARSPKIKTVRAMSRVLNVDASYLLGVDRESETERLISRFFALDEADRGKVSGYLDALLDDDKYKRAE